MRADLATATANAVANRSLPTTPWVQPPAVQSSMTAAPHQQLTTPPPVPTSGGWYASQLPGGQTGWSSQVYFPIQSQSETPVTHFADADSRAATSYNRSDGRGGNRRNKIDRNVCRGCFQVGHWIRECPNRQRLETESKQTGAELRGNPTVGGITSDNISSDQSGDVHMHILINNTKVSAILDTGCEYSVCGRCYVPPEVEIHPVDTVLQAANATSINVIGISKIFFKVQGREYYVNILISNDLTEFILVATG